MSKLSTVTLEDELQSSYVDYAMSVIIGRAIPDVRDGLKPVQRRILYTMYNMNNVHNQPTKKSARIVGECFIKDTLVLTNRGLLPIQNINKGDSVYTQSGLHEVTQTYVMPRRRLVKIRLQNGIENIVTSSQQFKIITPDWKLIWKEATKLEYGDYVLTKSFYPDINQEVTINDKKLNENIGYLLGQLLSDGYIIADNARGYHRVGFCSVSANVMNHILLCFEREFNYTPKIHEKLSEYVSVNGQIVCSKLYYTSISPQVSKFFIEAASLLGSRAWAKRIPNEIFASPKKVIFAFLSGLFDGDGCIHAERNNIQYVTTSQEMANQLMILLQHLGIHGRKYLTKQKEGYILGRKTHSRDSFSLEFDGINAHYLSAEIKMNNEKRSERLTNFSHHRFGKSSADIIPWAAENIFTELSNHHLGGGWYVDANGDKFRSGIKYPTGAKIRYSSQLHDLSLHISQIIEWGIQNKLNKINSSLAPFIEAIINENIRFSPVVSIEEAGEDVTYDVQVENEHELIANGMISHNCMGKFHPHGDSPIYEALVRMAQDFSMNHTLVEGQGNFGSTDGDPPAAMRYTEVRLSKIADEMLGDLDKETVAFVPNFDNTEKEPEVLPAMMPNMLINGASGIAVGVATSIPPHNLSEVCDALVHVLEHKEATTDDLMGIIKGPDFPTGGIAIMSQSAYNGYRYGRGQLTLRAKTKIDEKKHRIEITEMPYNVNKATFIENVAHLAREKKILGIRDIRDESGRGGVSVIIELREDATPEQVLNQLYKHTQLEVTLPLINLAVLGKMLKSFNIVQMINAFINYRREVISKRSAFELNVAKERLHIISGLLIAISRISDVIDTIKKSKEVGDARKNLLSNYALSEKQANAILEMRLSRLTQLENDSLNKEKSEMESKIAYHSEVLSKPAKVDEIIKDETLEMKKKYGRERRTEIVYMEQQAEIQDEDLISDEEVSIILTNSGYVKRMSIGSYKDQDRGGKGIIAMNLKEGDFIKHMITARNKDFIICVSNLGRIYWLKAYNIPEGGRYSEGKAIVNLLNLKDERIVNIFNIKDFSKSEIAFLTSKGTVKKINASLFSKPRTTGVRAITVNEGDELSDAIVFTGTPLLIAVTKSGKSIKFSEADIRQTGRSAAGVRGIRLRENDIAKNIIAASGVGSILTVSEKGYGKITDISEYRTQGRGGSGVLNLKVNEKTGPVAKALFVNKEKKLLLINSLGVSIMIPIASIRVTGRAASGVRLMKLEPGAKVIDAKLMEDSDSSNGLPQSNANP